MLSTSLFMWLSSIVHLQLSTSPSLSTRRSVCLSVSTYIYQNILIHIITVHIINPSPNLSINWYNHYIYNALLTCTSWSLSPWRSNTANCHTEALPWRCRKQNDSKLSFYLTSSCKLLAVQISRSWKFWRLETLKRDLRKFPKSFEGFLSKVTNLPLNFQVKPAEIPRTSFPSKSGWNFPGSKNGWRMTSPRRFSPSNNGP